MVRRLWPSILTKTKQAMRGDYDSSERFGRGGFEKRNFDGDGYDKRHGDGGNFSRKQSDGGNFSRKQSDGGNVAKLFVGSVPKTATQDDVS
ncbi:hypothetical protein Hanom_Chr07g00641461 [Helianthus anomalus]